MKIRVLLLLAALIFTVSINPSDAAKVTGPDPSDKPDVTHDGKNTSIDFDHPDKNSDGKGSGKGSGDGGGSVGGNKDTPGDRGGWHDHGGDHDSRDSKGSGNKGGHSGAPQSRDRDWATQNRERRESSFANSKAAGSATQDPKLNEHEIEKPDFDPRGFTDPRSSAKPNDPDSARAAAAALKPLRESSPAEDAAQARVELGSRIQGVLNGAGGPPPADSKAIADISPSPSTMPPADGPVDLPAPISIPSEYLKPSEDTRELSPSELADHQKSVDHVSGQIGTALQDHPLPDPQQQRMATESVKAADVYNQFSKEASKRKEDYKAAARFVRTAEKILKEVAPAAFSTGLSFVPGVGEFKAAVEVITGKDLVTGEPLSTLDRIVSLGGLFVGGSSALRNFERSVVKEISLGEKATVAAEKAAMAETRAAKADAGFQEIATKEISAEKIADTVERLGPIEAGGAKGKMANPALKLGSQEKHIVGKNNFKVGNSEWTGGDPQKAILEKMGTGEKKGTKGWNGKEVVEFDHEIGIYVNEEGVRLSTSRATIHYGASGAHIVPAHPTGLK